MITGDFNIRCASWIDPGREDAPAQLVPGTQEVQSLSDFLSLTNTHQFNIMYNINRRVLDLIICNKICRVTGSDHPMTREDMHHRSLDISLDVDFTNLLKSASKYVYNFRAANYEEISRELFNINWKTTFTSLMSTDECVQTFYSLLNDFIAR